MFKLNKQKKIGCPPPLIAFLGVGWIKEKCKIHTIQENEEHLKHKFKKGPPKQIHKSLQFKENRGVKFLINLSV